MNKMGIKWLYQELPELITKGILTEEIADKMRQYYGEVKSISKTTVIPSRGQPLNVEFILTIQFFRIQYRYGPSLQIAR